MSDSALSVEILDERGGGGTSPPEDPSDLPGAGWCMAVCRPGATAPLVGAASGEVRVYPGLDLAIAPTPDELARLLAPRDIERTVITQAAGAGSWSLVGALDRVARLARRQEARPVRPHPELIGGRLPGDGDGYPVRPETGGPLAADRSIDWAAEPAVLPVVNLSLGPSSVLHPVDAGDPVQAATYACSRWALVIAAAGNSGGDGSRETMSAWAEPHWVLAVGATRTAADGGRELAPRSSRGSRDRPWSGPPLVADGHSALDAGHFGTSFAAPRVAGLACHLAAAILQLGHLGRRAAGGEVVGVPLVAPILVDSFGGGRWFAGPDRLATPALPILGPNSLAAEVMGHLARRESTAVARGTAALLGGLLIEAARPLPGYATHEVGHGEIDRAGVVSLLCRLSAADWVRRLGLGHLIDAIPERLHPVPLFNQDGLNSLMEVVEASWPLVMCDRHTAELRVRPPAA